MNPVFYKWTLKVKARGYWFTSGGEKGSFGYYPHLKQSVGGRQYPVYPDTQIHGDIKMAAFWLGNLNPDKYSRDFVTKVFGDRNEPTKHTRKQSHVFVTDLELEDKAKWKDCNFQVKPRISVEDNRTVKEHMLVSLECAYLEGLTLKSDVYLYGYFSDHEFSKAKTLIEESVTLLSGFGAFRSRGYGRGKISLEAQSVERRQITVPSGNKFIFTLTSLTNFRNRQIEPGTEQTLKSEPFISADKIRAWFVKAYYQRYGKWITPKESAEISFSYLYPTKKDAPVLTYPVAVSSLSDKKGKAFDLTGRGVVNEERENLFGTKMTTLSDDCFVTDADRPILYQVKVQRRIRNSTEEDFSTLKEGGLIVQEFVPAGQVFGGVVSFKPDSEIGKGFIDILSNDICLINGCIFKPNLIALQSNPQVVSNSPYLVTEPIDFSISDGMINFKDCPYEKVDGRFQSKGANQVRLATKRAYNTMLNRQRRPRIVIQPGSVIHGAVDNPQRFKYSLLDWKGFGKDMEVYKEAPPTKTAPKYEMTSPSEDVSIVLNKLIGDGITPSQAGFLRGYLNEKQDVGFLKKLTKDRIEKYNKKGKAGFSELYSKLNEDLELNNLPQMRHFIHNLLDELYNYWWDKKVGKER